MYPGRGQQGRDRGVLPVDAAIRQHQERGPGLDGGARLRTKRIHRLCQPRGARARVEQHRQRRGPERRVGQVTQLRKLAVRQHRVVDLDLVARRGLGREQVALGPEGRPHIGHQLLADGVERGIGDLREELLEVVVEQPRAVRQYRERGVRSHRSDRFRALLGHRGDEDAQVLLRVAERALAAQHGLTRRPGVRRRGRQGVDVHQLLLEPLGVGMLGGELLLDLFVVDDAPLGGVDEEDAAGAQAILDPHVLRRDVQDADLGRHDDHVVVGDVVAGRPQSVAIEHGADHGAVGERNRGRPVPRLHQRGVILVEGAPVGGHRLVVRPRLRDHHQHRVRERAAGENEELEHVVERGGVALPLVDERKQLLQVVAEQIRPAQRLARAHPVDVAPQRVDLPVVGDVAVGVRQRPRREGVGAEPRVDEGERRLEVRVRQVGEHRLDLVGDEHPLVHDGVRRQARDIEEVALGRIELVHGQADALPDDVEPAFEAGACPAGTGVRRLGRRRRGAADEHLPHHRLAAAGGRPERGAVRRHVAPAQQALPLFIDDSREEVLDAAPLARVPRQEHHADAVLAGAGQVDTGGGRRLRQEAVRHLQEHAGAVAGVDLAAARAPVQQVQADLERLPHELVRPFALDVDHEPYAARVVLEPGVVEALLRRPPAGGTGPRCASVPSRRWHGHGSFSRPWSRRKWRAAGRAA